ncbi:hypothetical protein HWV62_25298 [Athelia sp. TMB]|nr:hypothetical protein HWV62_25298 [Athelia sp. TMB]
MRGKGGVMGKGRAHPSRKHRRRTLAQWNQFKEDCLGVGGKENIPLQPPQATQPPHATPISPRRTRSYASAVKIKPVTVAPRTLTPDAKRVKTLQAKLQVSQQKIQQRDTQLRAARSISRDLNAELALAKPALADATTALAEATTALAVALEHTASLEEANAGAVSKLRVMRRKLRRSQTRACELQLQLSKMRDEDLASLRVRLRYTEIRAADAAQKLSSAIKDAVGEKETHQKELAACRDRMWALEKRCARAPKILARAVEKAEARGRRAASQSTQVRIRRGGVYTSESRALFRMLVKSGCAPAHVGKVTEGIAKLAGAKIHCNVSRRTVGRAILEGGVAAQIQLGFEIHETPCKFSRIVRLSSFTHVLIAVTLSSDGTSHRHEDYMARHLAMKAPSYQPGYDPAEKTHKNRLFGVHSSISKSAEQEFADWKKEIGEIVTIFTESPFAKRHGLTFDIKEFVRKLRGMMGDHASPVIKTAGLWETFRKSIIYGDLGSKVLSMKDPGELLAFLQQENEKKIAALGGRLVWDAMSTAAQDAADEIFVQEMLQTLGKAAHADLPDDVRRAMDFFVRAGCCMHKDLNAVKGGAKAMARAWFEIPGATPPVLLANKANDITLSNMSSDGPRTEPEKHALEVTTRGGIKAVSLAGAIFNNQNDKKGQQDTHRQFFEHQFQYTFNFPDTSNTRYGSNCDGAAELLLYLEKYLEFLLFIKDSKTQRNFNHIELNLYKALCDPPTLSELAVLALYAQSVTHPYMQQVRGPGTEKVNALDLGPLHRQVQKHVAKIAADPNLLISDEADYTLATLDGRMWHEPKVVMAILARKKELPYLPELITAFFEGTLETWMRFTSEFAPGGLIDMSTIEERDLAWMPSTNDANEGALGSFRVCLRDKPSLTMHQYNARALFHRNDTQLFMDALFTEEEDMQYLRQKAREIDASGLSKLRKEANAIHKQRLVDEKRQKDADREKKKQDRASQLAGVSMVLDKVKLRKMNNADLKQQINLHYNLKSKSDRLPPAKSSLTNKVKMLEALDDAINHFLTLPTISRSVSTLDVVANNVHITVEDGWDSDGMDDT